MKSDIARPDPIILLRRKLIKNVTGEKMDF